MKKKQWLYLRDVYPANIKVLCQMEIPDGSRDGEIEIVLRSSKEDQGIRVPDKPLLVYHVNTGRCGIAEIMKADSFYAPLILSNWQLDLSDRQTLLIEAECYNGTLSLSINKKLALMVKDKYVSSENPLFVSLRSNLKEICLQSLEVYRLAPPENTTLLLAGDTLLQEKLYDKAIMNYIKIDDSRPGTPLAEKALLQAYIIASTHLKEPQLSSVCLDIKKRLAVRYPKFQKLSLLETDVCMAWKNHNYALASELINHIFSLDSNTKIVSSILALPHSPLTAEAADILFKTIQRSKGITTLDLSGFGLTSLNGIAGLPLISLNCSRNQLTDLSLLQGMPLQSLNCADNNLTSLDPIWKLPLRYLDCSNNRISDFRILSSMPLERLCTENNPGTVAPVRGNLREIHFIRGK